MFRIRSCQSCAGAVKKAARRNSEHNFKDGMHSRFPFCFYLLFVEGYCYGFGFEVGRATLRKRNTSTEGHNKHFDSQDLGRGFSES